MIGLTKIIATEIARKHISQLATAAGDSFELLLEEAKDVAQGWLFSFNTCDFVRSRNPADALAGNGPILVLQNGQVRELSSTIPWKQALKHI